MKDVPIAPRSFNEWETQQSDHIQNPRDDEQTKDNVEIPKTYPEGTQFDENGLPSGKPLPTPDFPGRVLDPTAGDVSNWLPQYGQNSTRPLPEEYRPLLPFEPWMKDVEDDVADLQPPRNNNAADVPDSGVAPNYTNPPTTFQSAPTAGSQASSCRYAFFGWCVWR